jgi:broad specificity phosphatase PhoE
VRASTRMTRIHFVRHGAVDNPNRVFYGRLPGFPLSEEGRRQAQAAAEALLPYPIGAVFSSPMQRARETAQYIAALHHGLEVGISELLAEICTPYDGRPVSVAAKRDWDIYSGNEPPHEQPGDVLARVLRFVTLVREQCAGQHIVAVTHGDLIAFLMVWARGMPVTVDSRQVMYKDYVAKASITTVTYATASPHEVPTVEYHVPY